MRKPENVLQRSSLQRLGQSRVNGEEKEWSQFVRSITKKGYEVMIEIVDGNRVVIVHKQSNI